MSGFLWLLSFAIAICAKDFRSAPTTVKAPENDTVLLPCYLDIISSDDPEHTRIRWYKSGQLLADSGPPPMLTPQRIVLWGNGSLQVNNLEPQDTAEYTCEVVRPAPWSTVQQSHAIEVLHAPSVQPDPLSGFLEVKLREEVRMSCKTQGVPYPIITWLHKGQELQLLDNREMLKFSALDRHLAGEYQCMARNGVGDPALATIQLNIIYPPEVMAPRTWIHTAPGIRTQIICVVSADPDAVIIWMKGEMPITFNNRIIPMIDGEKQILLIRNATVGDFGIYTCRATNDLGQGEAQIQLSGIANPALFKHTDQSGIPKNSHKLVWEVDSYTPIIEYKLYFRPYKARNKLKNADWLFLTIPAEHNTGPVHAKSYIIRGLHSKTVYEAMLTSRNRYGWSKPSPILRFATEGAELNEEVITPVQVQMSEDYLPTEFAAVASPMCINKLMFLSVLIALQMFEIY